MATVNFPFTASRWQVATYLFGVALFSISFLVFLNSAVSFVITDLIGQHDRVGDAVGTLGFADEIIALVACPAWGIISDRIGVRTVAVIGYGIVGLSLFLFVQAHNVYPQLLLARLLFSLGGSATATMVTAILPTMTQKKTCGSSPRNGPYASTHIVTPSISSELTITPARFRSQSPRIRPPLQRRNSGTTSNLAGLVGMFTGLGALIALGVFLPLPARFQAIGKSATTAVKDSFYIVGSIAFVVAVLCFFGLRKLPGEDKKSWRKLLPEKYQGLEQVQEDSKPPPPFLHLLLGALLLGFQDLGIGLGYLGGFVARASSVGISLFIPLYVNAYFIRSGACHPGSGDDMKHECRRAYTLAASLTGTSQLTALIFAPVFGYLSGRYKRFNIPLLTGAFAGIFGYIAFALLESPDPRSDKGTGAIFLIVAVLGFSQIGAIVCSLGLLARGIQQEPESIPSMYGHSSNHTQVENESLPSSSVAASPAVRDPPLRNPFDEPPVSIDGRENDQLDGTANGESVPLLTDVATKPKKHISRPELKGSISGIYSLSGGAGILLLTKLGGLLFDDLNPGAPFWMLAIFNFVLFFIGFITSVIHEVKERERRRLEGPFF